MPLLANLPLTLTIDDILLAQGADPARAREQSPRLVDLAAQALEIGRPLLQPVVAYRLWKLKAVQHERLLLSDNGVQAALSGKALARLLASSRQVVLLLGTIGSALETHVSILLPANPPLGLALDAVGSAAVQSLLEAACAQIGRDAGQRGWQATVPLSPGMEGWPAGPGQAQVFAALDAPLPDDPAGLPLTAQVGVSLNESGMMVPLKSLTAVIGLGPEVESTGRVCDYCSIRQTCRYQDTEYRI